MTHPLLSLSPRAFRRVYWGFFAATIACSAVLQSIGSTYAAKKGPDGARYDVIAFEFAGTPEKVAVMLETWGEDGIAAARLQTLLDYLFLCLYSTLTAAGILAVGANLPAGSLLARLGIALAWAQWAAGLCDAVENAGLLISLSGPPQSPWPQVSFVFAAVKFALLGAGVVYIFLLLPWARPATDRDA